MNPFQARSHRRRQPAQPAATAAADPRPTEHPPILLLAADAASLSARRLHSFPDAAAAAEFIAFWFPNGRRPGLTAFWALPGAPVDVDAEAVVLIHHCTNPQLFYSVSFTSMEGALEMARAEVARGLWLGRIAIFYAVAIQIDYDATGRPAVCPGEPPQFERPDCAQLGAGTPAQSAVPTIASDGLRDRAFDAVRLRRWMAHGTPFAGFGSPPGRF